MRLASKSHRISSWFAIFRLRANDLSTSWNGAIDFLQRRVGTCDEVWVFIRLLRTNCWTNGKIIDETIRVPDFTHHQIWNWIDHRVLKPLEPYRSELFLLQTLHSWSFLNLLINFALSQIEILLITNSNITTCHVDALIIPSLYFGLNVDLLWRIEIHVTQTLVGVIEEVSLTAMSINLKPRRLARTLILAVV